MRRLAGRVLGVVAAFLLLAVAFMGGVAFGREQAKEELRAKFFKIFSDSPTQEATVHKDDTKPTQAPEEPETKLAFDVAGKRRFGGGGCSMTIRITSVPGDVDRIKLFVMDKDWAVLDSDTAHSRRTFVVKELVEFNFFHAACSRIEHWQWQWR